MIDIIMGSKKSDQPLWEESKAKEVLTECGIPWRLSYISAHRHPEKLKKHCGDVMLGGVDAFIAAAGMAAHLPGAVATNSGFIIPVIGVALPSKEFPNAMDALMSIARMPAGCPVAVAGIGASGLRNAAIYAASIVANKNKKVKEALAAYLKKNTPAPDENCESSEGEGQ